MQVTIIDTRPQWMKQEDELMACMVHCPLFKRCKSKFGHKCKRLGGSEIPRIDSR